MGRPRGAPTRRKELRLEAQQIEMLEAMIATAPIGKPSLVSLVRQAVEEFIDRQLNKPGMRERVERHLKESRRVVNLHEVRTDT